MRIAMIAVVAVVVAGLGAPAALGDDWVTVYQTDFTTDPGWTTNNASHFYWDSALHTYYQQQINGSQEYAFKLLGTVLSSPKWRIEYDIKPVSVSNQANAGVALTDPLCSHQNGRQMTLDFAQIGAGYYPHIEYTDTNSFSGAQMSSSFSLNVWYHTYLEWDSAIGQLYGRVTRVSDGALVTEKTRTGIGDIEGLDRVAMTTIDHTYSSGAGATAYIDNIVVLQTPEPATLALLALGAAGLVARRRKAGSKATALLPAVGLAFLAVFGLGGMEAKAAPMVYDLATDWSDTQNPNGAWSFNLGSTVLTNWHDIGESTVWDLDGSTNPSWAKTKVGGGWNDRQIGDIVPQSWWFGSDRTNVTWTSPSDGIVDIAGRSWDAYGGRGGDWTLTVDGVDIAHRDQIVYLKRDQFGANFADNLLPGMSLNNIPVNAGDVIMFSVGGGSTSGVALEITLTPEPATLALLGLGAAGLVARRRNKK
jgi:hypothetical protein